MARLETLMRTVEKDRYVDRMNNRTTAVARDEEILADLQRRFDHLAGVPPTTAPVVL